MVLGTSMFYPVQRDQNSFKGSYAGAEYDVLPS